MTMQVQNLIISNTMRVSNHKAVHMINTAKRKTTVFSLQIYLWARNLGEIRQTQRLRH